MARPREFNADEVLDRSMRLFWAQGYEATSLDDLLRETGLARQSLYNSFGGKHALFLAALSRYKEQAQDTVRACFEEGASVKETLRAFLLDIAEAPPERLRLGCLVVNSAVELSPHDPETARLVAAQYRFMELLLRDALERAQEDGGLPAHKDPRAIARFLVGFLNGLHVVAKSHPDRGVLRDMVKVALQVLD